MPTNKSGRGRRLGVLALVMLALASTAPVYGANERSKPPPSKRTQTLSQKVFKQLEEAQKANDAKDYRGALDVLNRIKKDYDRLNDYEKAMLWNFYAAIHYSLEDIPSTLNAYRQVLAQKNLPEGLRNTALYALAQLHFVTEDYREALKLLQRWMSFQESVRPDAYMLEAQAYYQLNNFKSSEASILKALRVAREREIQPKENWLALLRAVYYEQNNYNDAAKVLELLIYYYPKESYYRQLAGMYGLMDRPVDQLAVLRGAYEAGVLEKESDLLNLARLYVSKEAPFPAIKLLKKELASKRIETNEDSLTLYAQALGLAQEYEAQIPILAQLAKTTKKGSHYVYLGQAQIALANWNEAADAYRNALKDKNLDRPGMAWLNIGTALFNADKLEEARDAFKKALKYERAEKSARNWITFINREIERKAFLESY